MVEEAAEALVPGPVATTALATLVISDAGLLEALASGERTAGLALDADITFDGQNATGTARFVLGALPDGVLVLPAGDTWLLVDGTAASATVTPLTATDFSRPLARVELNAVPAKIIELPFQRVVDLAATVLAAETAGLARWQLETAAEYAKVREQFGKPIGSFQAIKHMCSEMLCGPSRLPWLPRTWPRRRGARRRPAFHRRRRGCRSRHRGGETQCPRLHSGTRRHRLHLGARRPPISAPGIFASRRFLGGRGRWLRRVAALTRDGARRQLHVDPVMARPPGRRSPPRSPRSRRCPPSSTRGRWRRRASGAALASALRPRRVAGRTAGDRRRVGKAGVVRPDISIGWWAAPTILEAGTPEQIERFIPGTLTETSTGASCLVSRAPASDLAALRTKASVARARGVMAGWQLTGQKVWTSNAHRAQLGYCLARTNPDAPKHKGITYFVVDMTSPGIEIRPLREITGEALFNEVFLDNVFVPDEWWSARSTAAGALARTTLANERVAMAAGGALDKGDGGPARGARGCRSGRRRQRNGLAR